MELTVKELATLIGGVLEGNADAKVSSFAKIEEASKGDLTFLANPKYTHYIYSTSATAILINKDFKAEDALPPALSLIRVDDPYSTLARLMSIAESYTAKPAGIEQPCFIGEGVEIHNSNYIGAFAYIGKGTKIAEDVLIYPQAYIGENVEIGEGSIIYAGAKIYKGCKIGKRCIVHSGAVIGADGFGFAPTADGYKKIPQIGNVVLDDDTEIGANTTIDRATMGSTRIGKGSKLDNLIQVAHNVVIGCNNVFAAQTGIAGSTQIGNNNMVGGQVGFAGHISIGDNNEIGAQSGIPNNVGDGKRLMGYPAVEAREFAKNLVYIKKLSSLFKK